MSTRVTSVVLSIAAGSMLAGLTAGGAAAQSLASPDASVDMFSRNRNVSVQARPRPDYEALGVRAGAFLIYPKIELAGEFNDNIYAAGTGEVDDFIVHIRPEVAIESTWSQHFLTAYARGSINRYQDFDTENTEEFGAGGSARIDVTRLSNIGLGADYLSSFEPRTAPNAPSASVEPIALDTAQAYVSGSRTSGRVRLSGRADWRKFDYEDGRTAAGAVIEQDTRDRDTASLSGRVDVAISPDTAFFFQATGNERTYDIASTPALANRDSSGAEYLVGASFEVGAAARGEIAVGYIDQQYDEAVYDDVSGFGGRAQLEWFATELTTITVAGGRTIEDAVNPGASGYLASSASIRIDHELLRNVILTGQLTYSDDEYEGIDRQDNRFGASVGATYLINRYFGVNASLSMLDTDSSGADRDDDFTVNKLSIALVSQF